MAFGIVFSLDYEIHGNGAGSPMELMVEPTWRLLRQLEQFGGKLTIFAEAMEILRFREHFRATGRDDFAYEAIAEQLRYAVTHGHDVQLHIHPSYANAVLENGRWKQDWSEYDTARLPAPRIQAVLAEAAGVLDEILKPVQPDYTMYAFRAGNWAMMPTRNIADALIERGILIDSSVFKGGKRDHVARFDYADAHSALLPWRADRDNICHVDPSSPLWEYPIYCEMRSIWAFVSPNRFYRVFQTRTNRLGDEEPPPAEAGAPRPGTLARLGATLFGKHAWKADFNQCSGPQLVAALKRAKATYGAEPGLLPFVMIGHSKTYGRYNEATLERFLAFAASHATEFRFAVYRDFLQGLQAFA
jgi:hypothetical protein